MFEPTFNEAARPLKITRRLVGGSRRSVFSKLRSNYFVQLCTAGMPRRAGARGELGKAENKGIKKRKN